MKKNVLLLAACLMSLCSCSSQNNASVCASETVKITFSNYSTFIGLGFESYQLSSYATCQCTFSKNDVYKYCTNCGQLNAYVKYEYYIVMGGITNTKTGVCGTDNWVGGLTFKSNKTMDEKGVNDPLCTIKVVDAWGEFIPSN
jgi:hypothetical protein